MNDSAHTPGILSMQEHAATIATWIESCTTVEQLKLCRQAADHFIKSRFMYIEAPSKVNAVLNYLEECIDVKEMKLQRTSATVAA